MMKNWIVLISIFFVTLSTQAQIKKAYQQAKQALTGSAKISQLHYFPEPWEVDLNLGYRYTAITLNAKSTGIMVIEANQLTSTAFTEVTLGLFDHVYTQLKLDYLVNFNVDYSIPASQASIKSTGLADPELAAVVRVFDGDRVKLDGKIKFSPNTGEQKDPDATNEGNAKSGGSAATLGGRFLALVTDSSQIGLTLDYTMFGEKKSVDQSNGRLTETAKNNQLEIEIATLTEIANDLFFGLALTIVNIESYQTTNLTTLATTDYGSTSGKSLDLIGKYEFTPDSAVTLQAGYVIDYSTSIGNLDVSATGYNLSASYLIRF